MQFINFPEALHDLMQDYRKQNKPEYWEESDYGTIGLAFRFSYIRIVKGTPIHDLVLYTLAHLGYKKVNGLRINVFEGDHYIGKHIDQAFAGHDTLIIPIELDVYPRFRIWSFSDSVKNIDSTKDCSFLLDEKPLQGIILPEGTMHEVTMSTIAKGRRVTLCGWISKE